MAAGATIGSNHNSRSPDGELIAGRGFWPGLCVSLKHNSKFASFSILAKGDYPSELNIQIPFSLVSNDTSADELVVMPAYWFQYNMYALARNSWKYVDRDRRIDKTQLIEFDYLAPDTINEIITGISLLEEYTGKASLHKKGINGKIASKENCIQTGRELLESKSAILNDLDIVAKGFENSERPVRLVKVIQAYSIFKELVAYYTVQQVLSFMETEKIKNLDQLKEKLPPRTNLTEWVNAGGQLIPKAELDKFLKLIVAGKVKGWNAVHDFYSVQGKKYQFEKLNHALAAYKQAYGVSFQKTITAGFADLLKMSLRTREWMVDGIMESRAKDYQNPFRKMVYESEEEMNKVVGKLNENSFINQEREALEAYKKKIQLLIKKINPKVAV